ncbi:conserved hypothetical protein [Burkholderia cenocepacia HI2424]|uniref:Uncharacterized protein n=1 Tax=Burkholderia orbicola (strain AU 1054) TaxID=331271 RepID=A0A0H2Y114_BURO1|nr:conserved hypothetical protein [Burkholderia cenocepacia HI2424]
MRQCMLAADNGRGQGSLRRAHAVSVAAAAPPNSDWRPAHGSPSVPGRGWRSVSDHADGHDLVPGVGIRARGLLRFVIRTKGGGILDGRRHADIAVLGGAKELLAGLHDIDGHHDSLQGLQGEISV